jgi:hypothetical protein
VIKKTPWFDGSQKPVRVGVYQRKYEAGIRFCWFDGKRFGCNSRSASDAYHQYSIFGASFDRDLAWRGLASNPAEGK